MHSHILEVIKGLENKKRGFCSKSKAQPDFIRVEVERISLPIIHKTSFSQNKLKLFFKRNQFFEAESSANSKATAIPPSPTAPWENAR